MDRFGDSLQIVPHTNDRRLLAAEIFDSGEVDQNTNAYASTINIVPSGNCENPRINRFGRRVPSIF